jgi:hypothetical protein
MFQAHEGDLLRIHTVRESIIIDAGPPGCSATLARLLRSRARCRLLILTHLDQDHYGGLRALVDAALKQRAPRGIHWPQTVWLNDFEPRGTLNALMDGVEEDGDADEYLHAAVGAASAWAERNRLVILDGHSEDDPNRREEPPLLDARVHVMVGPDAFDYLRRLLDQPTEMLLADVEAAVRNALSLLALALDIDAGTERDREQPDLRRRVNDALRRCNAILDRGAPMRRRHPSALLFPGAVVTVSPAPGVTVRVLDPELRHRLSDGEDITQHLPPEVGGLVHLARDGPALLHDLQRDHETVTLADALRSLPGVRVEAATAGRRARPFGTDLLLQVLGPGRTDLKELRRDWRRIREKGRVHVRRSMLAFMEASLFDVARARYSIDRSVTNRSSIQVLASTASGYAVLTGDGRPDTLTEGLRTAHVPPSRCTVFKAAHHGSAHNIVLTEDPNATLYRLNPHALWISGKDKAPATAFVDYIERQRLWFGFAISATNLNADLRKIGGVTPLAGPCIWTRL